MGIFGPSRREIESAVQTAVTAALEQRASIEDPKVPISASNIVEFLGLHGISASGKRVTIDNALGVPPVWAAVNFLSGTLAGLPCVLYRKTGKGREKVNGGLAAILHDAVNEETSSFDWRKSFFDAVFTGGRGLTFIERSASRKVSNLWPLDPTKATVKRVDGRKSYEYRDGRRTHVYAASEVIDMAYMLHSDLLRHRSPILTNKEAVGLAMAVTDYGAKFFNNGGVPPFVLTGPFNSPGALARSSTDMEQAVREAAEKRKLALSLPTGHEIKSIGADPEKSQLVELQRFIIEQIARIYSLPPVFLQDLTHGTFSNTEQQDLHLTKHTLTRLAKQFEQELNLKLFGRWNNRQYVELNLDGLLRGDFKSRMEGNARAIQTGQLTPDEAREMENRPATGGAAGELHMQGAMMPIDKLGQLPARGLGDSAGPALDDDQKDDLNG
ncbi:phage portal protein [Aminobacter sp. NyZ550]|uniref:phage portal protein n=1 Tax=Aminobacter sp. NyZ550 TaxID=2979870 RepID=UPI0021D5CD67|nr:phage portal protein [Aminobacter sp. NyZ550]WAX93187.1 phage portal protein [Aminobacter sp. NyZ550]